ncbi:urease accessory protein UreD [Mycobacterium sp. 141]|uniref:urease accessory protein UreD n=1 Tax=Mycobacterium sp. 141 TaxID=1120797 RepID=UPI000366E666|nr:urease accessory protein UreD [Mycobacterium sp. 141]
MTTATLDASAYSSGEIGKHGSLVVRAMVERGKTRLQPTFRRIPYQWHGAHYQDNDDQPFLLVQNSGGGFVEGDSGRFHLTMEPGTRALVTTTEATKFYRSEGGGSSAESYRFDVGANALLEYVPDEVIPYAGCRAVRDTRFCLTSPSRLFAAEVMVAGRVHFRRDELFGFTALRSRFQVDIDGVPRYLDNLIAEGADIPKIARTWGGHCVLGTIVVYGHPDDGLAAQVEQALSADETIHAGASVRSGILVVRILGSATWRVHDAVYEVWRQVRPALADKPARRILKC